jgi:hypothetical protein
MARVEVRGPSGAQYKAVAVQDVATVVGCAKGFVIVDQPEPNMAVAQQDARGNLDAWIGQQLAAGRGVVLVLPTFGGAPSSSQLPQRTGVALFCQPDPSFPISVSALATDSLNEARRFMAASPESVVLSDPKGGWIELGGSPAKAGMGWGIIAAAAIVVGVVGWFVVKQR